MKLAPQAKLRIAQKLRELREAHGMTQADLGRQLGRACTTVASWESGKGQPDADTLLRLMDFYRVEDVVAEFGYGEPEENALTRRERELIEQLRALDAPARELVRLVVNELAGLAVSERPPLLAVARGKRGGGVLEADAAAIDALPDEGWPADESR